MKRRSTRLEALEKRLAPREPVFGPRTAEDDAAWLRSMTSLRAAFLEGIDGVYKAVDDDPVIADLDALIARGKPETDERKTQ